MELTRRRFLSAAGGMLAAAAVGRSGLAAAGDPAKRFNILWLIADQHTFGALGCAGNPAIHTPNLDRLAAGGARFANASCVTPFCSPTRASWITGFYPHSHGIVINVDGAAHRLKDPCACAENILCDGGWATAHLGKWHLGWETDLHCYRDGSTMAQQSQRYARELLKPAGDQAYDEPRPGEIPIENAPKPYALTDEMAAIRLVKSKLTPKEKLALAATGKKPEVPPEIGRALLKPEYRYESWLADQAIAWMEQHKNRNFMLTYSVSPPHPAFLCPAPYYDMYDPAKLPLPPNFADRTAAYQKETAARTGAAFNEACFREYIRCYYGMVTMVDAYIGRILDALKRLGLEENTLVVYTSDHGNNVASHGFVDKAVFAFYEECLRVPLILRYPGQIRPGSVFHSAAASLDLMPTMLDYAGAPIPSGVQGRSLRPIIEGRAPDVFDAAFCERGLGAKENTGMPREARYGRMIRTATAKFSYYDDGRRELFDLANDPGEMKDVAQDPQYLALRDSLHARLLEQARQTGDPAADRIPSV